MATRALGVREYTSRRSMRRPAGRGRACRKAPTFPRSSKRSPGGLRPITVAHEITAVAMAHGYAPAALARGLDVVRHERRQALLNVIAR